MHFVMKKRSSIHHKKEVVVGEHTNLLDHGGKLQLWRDHIIHLCSKQWRISSGGNNNRTLEKFRDLIIDEDWDWQLKIKLEFRLQHDDFKYTQSTCGKYSLQHIEWFEEQLKFNQKYHDLSRFENFKTSQTNNQNLVLCLI